MKSSPASVLVSEASPARSQPSFPPLPCRGGWAAGRPGTAVSSLTPGSSRQTSPGPSPACLLSRGGHLACFLTSGGVPCRENQGPLPAGHLPGVRMVRGMAQTEDVWLPRMSQGSRALLSCNHGPPPAIHSPATGASESTLWMWVKYEGVSGEVWARDS